MKSEEVLDILLLIKRLWPSWRMTREIAERLAGHFAKMDYQKTRTALIALTDSAKFAPTFGEIQKKLRELEADGAFKHLRNVNLEEEKRLQARADKLADFKYLLDQKRLTREEFDEFASRVDEVSVDEVYDCAFAGHHHEFNQLARDFFGQRIPKGEYERRRQQLEDEIRVAKQNRGPRQDEPSDAQ